MTQQSAKTSEVQRTEDPAKGECLKSRKYPLVLIFLIPVPVAYDE